MAIVFDHGAAARRIDNDSIDRAFGHDFAPRIDVGLGKRDRRGLLPHVMVERAATARARRDFHIHARTCEQANGGVVDIRA